MKNTIAELQNRKRELMQMCRLPEAREIANRIKFLEEKQKPAPKY